MDEKSDKKVAIVTGASKGIGRAISIELGQYGYYIVINYKSDGHGASQTLEMIKEAGGVYSINGELFGELPLTRETRCTVIAANKKRLHDEIMQLIE